MLKYDRTITISTGNSRRDLAWKQTIITISELYDRLRVPIRGSETYNEYLALKKPQQDALKDVGGFVGGALNGMRRKSSNVLGRDIVTLDFDNIPGWQTQAVIDKVDELNCSYCVYSTRKHTEGAPRLRILIPLDRTVTPDEYEPCARRIADQIGITMADPSTFEACRLMYWPSCCKDSNYVYQIKDAPLLSADFLLSTYEDWHNFSSWPQTPKGVSYQKLAMKQGDPLEKPGIVGAFCRTYDVVAAMETFLPGIYEAVDNADDRFTYLGGSTTGGAVLYDGAKFLFSHHATDPCSGRLVNSFDLVRLHKFGEKDTESNPDTPVTKLPSYKEMCELASGDELVRRQRALDDFSGTEYKDVTEASKIALAELSGKPLTIETTGTLLQALNIKVRYNQITHEIDATGMPPEYSAENRLNTLPILLYDRAKAAGVKNVSRDALPKYIDAHADKNRYNPVAELLDSVVWDGQDRFGVLCDILGIERAGLFSIFVRKWLTGCAAVLRNYGEQSTDGVLTLQGRQGCGKTSFFRRLFPGSLAPYFKEGANIDVNNVDSISQNTSCWVVELGELDSTLAREQTALKAFLTRPWDEYRKPYAAARVRHPRITAFCGTVNDERFLKDPTGNRRFWVVPVERIDLEKMAALDDGFFFQLWAQADVLARNDPAAHRLTDFERALLEKSNATHTEPLPGEEELLSFFDFDLPESAWGEFSAAELCANYHYGKVLQKYTARRIGKALAHIAAENKQIVKRVLHGTTRYKLPIPSAAVSDFGATGR